MLHVGCLKVELIFLLPLAIQLVSKANAIDEKHLQNFHITPIHYAHLLTGLCGHCKAEIQVHMAENIFLSVLTLFDPLATSLSLGIFLIMHGSAIARRGLTISVMTLWAEFH